jgi:superfamily II DNA or RNA helicase
LDAAIRWNFNDIVFEYNILPVEPSVHAHWFQKPTDYDPDLPWANRILLGNPGRKLACVELILDLMELDKNTLVMSPTIASLRNLRQLVERGAGSRGLGWIDSEIGYLTGKTPKSRRKAEAGKLLLFTTQHAALATEGLDRPQTEAVVVYGPCLGSRTFHQVIGRAARKYTGKDSAEVHFFCDDFEPNRSISEKRLREAERKGLEVIWETSTRRNASGI